MRVRQLQGPLCYAISPPVSTAPPVWRCFHLAERWQSGRMHRTRNAAWGQLHRGFESLPLRHFRHRRDAQKCCYVRVAAPLLPSPRKGLEDGSGALEDGQQQKCPDAAAHTAPQTVCPIVCPLVRLMLRPLGTWTVLGSRAMVRLNLADQRSTMVSRRALTATQVSALEAETVHWVAPSLLLRMTSLSVKQVAAEVGFANPFYFSLRFKRATGRRLTGYRNAAK